KPLLPLPARTGRPSADDRRIIDGILYILYILVTGCRWQDLPCEYGAPTTVLRRLKRWGKQASGSASGVRCSRPSTGRASSTGLWPFSTARSCLPSEVVRRLASRRR